MMVFFVMMISLIASVVGAICGIGGGVIIKPALDAFGLFSVSTASFYSGCTVLAMSAYSVLRNILQKGDNSIDLQRGTYLGIGSAIGGVTGRILFEGLKVLFARPQWLGIIQSTALFLITGATILYTSRKERIHTRQIEHAFVCTLVGLGLGIMSSFLGIGGGPINLVVLSYFFSMPTKTAAQNSLYIILLSQTFSLLYTLFFSTVPVFSWAALIGMVIMGVLGGMLGRSVNRHLNTKQIDKLFLFLLVLIMLVCIYNCLRYIA